MGGAARPFTKYIPVVSANTMQYSQTYDLPPYKVTFHAVEEAFLPQQACRRDAGIDLKLYHPEGLNTEDVLRQTSAFWTVDEVYIAGKLYPWRKLREQVESYGCNSWLMLKSNESVLARSGFAWEVQVDPEYPRVLAMSILPRSGLGSRSKLVLSNTVGLIDEKYRDEIKMTLWNNSPYIHLLPHGARVCQAVIFDCLDLGGGFQERSGGHGHSGV